MINLNIQLLDDSISGDKIYQVNDIQMVNLQRNSERTKNFQNSSLYILFGQNALKREIYIGQTSKIGRRLYEHNRKKDFWVESIFFINNRELTKTETEWLESQMIQLFINNNQFDIITNYQIPSNIVINEKDVPGLNEILKTYKLLINSFYGFRMILNESENKLNEDSNSIINRIAKAYKYLPEQSNEDEYDEDVKSIQYKDIKYYDIGGIYYIQKSDINQEKDLYFNSETKVKKFIDNL